MNQGPLIFLGVFLAMALSWYGMVVVPHAQLGRLQEANVPPANARYPTLKSGLAQQGREVYRANGCNYCHTQQVRAEAKYDVVLANAGTNKTELVKVILDLNAGLSAEAASKLADAAPAPLARGLRETAAADLARKFEELKKIGAPEAKVDVVVRYSGPDIQRGWGRRHSVAQDYLYERPVMLGNVRVGPDLANIGARQPDAATQLLHLYNPQISAKGSTMPPYPFLFETRQVIAKPSPDALKLPGEFGPPAGYEVVPKPEARALVAYLLSLQTDASLFESPLPLPPKKSGAEAATNQPPAAAEATSQSAAVPAFAHK
ncbi:MAG: ribosomal protein L7/L12 [Verrucomicrobia bacterium]|nr:ribosomal protein L7/L12 [Verrucomicrobiota bacterium]